MHNYFKGFGGLKAFAKSSLFAPLAFAVLTALLLSPVLLFHTTTFFTGLDNVDQFFTWYQKLATSWHHGYLPIWNANVYSGQSFAAELQPGVLYPLNWVWIALFGSAQGISEYALNWLVALHFWAAAYGAFLLIKQMGAERWAAFMAGLTFAFSGAVAGRSGGQTVIFFGLALLPYSLYFLVKYHSTKTHHKRYLISAGAFLGLLLLVGHIQPFFHALVAVIILELVFFYKRYKGGIRMQPNLTDSLKVFSVIGLATLVVAGAQMWISAPYLSDTYRIQASGYVHSEEKIPYKDFAAAFNLNIHEFSNLIDPKTYPIRDGNSIFIGLVPLVIILVAVFAAGKQFRKTRIWDRYADFTKILLLFSSLAMVGYATWFAVVLYEIPVVYQIRQLGRYAVLFDLGLMIAFTAGLQTVAKYSFTKRQSRNLLLAGLFLLVNAAYIMALRQYIFSGFLALHFGLLAVALIVLALCKSTKIRAVLLSFAVILSAGVNTFWFLPKIDSETKVSSIYTLPSPLVDTLEQTNGQYRIEDAEGALPVNIGNVYDVQSTGGYGATIYGPYFNIAHKDTLDKEFVRDIFGVRLLASKQKPAPSTNIVYQDPGSKVYIVERPTALSKIFYTDKVGSVDRADYHNLKTETRSYSDQYQKFEVTLDKPRNVIISEMYYTGWQAKLDGKVAKLDPYTLHGQPILKSLDIPEGTHTVELEYKPFGVF